MAGTTPTVTIFTFGLVTALQPRPSEEQHHQCIPSKALEVRSLVCADVTNSHLWKAKGSASGATFAYTLCDDSVVDIDGLCYGGVDGSNIIICFKNANWNHQWEIEYV